MTDQEQQEPDVPEGTVIWRMTAVASGEVRDAEGRLLDSEGNPVNESPEE